MSEPKRPGAVRVSPHFARSARVDADIGRPGALDSYLLTATAREALSTMARQISGSTQRAFTWTGPYGGGKSSLAVALATAVGRDAGSRREARRLLSADTIAGFTQAFPVRKGGWLVVPVSGRRTGAVLEIAKALRKALDRPAAGRVSEQSVIDGLLAAAESGDHDGILLLVDEMGKLLESAAAGGDDVHFFQELAESASRSEGRLVVVGILHQAFRQYASRLGSAARDEWAKVHGRPSDIPFVATGAEVVELIGRAIERDAPRPRSAPPAAPAAAAIAGRRPGMGEGLADLLERCWPLHPITAALLGPASRRQFGQNERSVFGFLSSLEPHGFQDFLAGWDGQSSYGPDLYWDYLRANLEPAILSSPDGHRWAQAAEAVSRAAAKGAGPAETSLIKAVAVIDLFRPVSGLAADDAVLRSALPWLADDAFAEALERLSQWRVAVFRRHVGAWTVFEGSDFDIESAVSKARGSFAEPDLATLTSMANLHPVVAKRHYHQTGTFRWMGVSLLRAGDAERFAEDYSPEGGEFGRFALVLPDRDAPAHAAVRAAKRVPLDPHRPVVFGVPPNHAQIADLGAELISLRIVQTTRPELEGDPVARREVSARLVAVKGAIEEALRVAVSDAQWIASGEARKGVRLSPLASDMADAIFRDAPRVWSELVNRDSLSTNSVKARRDLLHRMVDKAGEENLGLEGFPAERGLHETLLATTGMHAKDPDTGAWVLRPPVPGDEAGFHAVWSDTLSLVSGSGAETRADEIYALWGRPPYGIKDGLKPVLLTAFALAHPGNAAIYRDGVFVPALTDADVDELLQDPRRFSLRWVTAGTEHAAALASLSETLGKMGFPAGDASPLGVGRAMVALAFSVPAWARRTQRLSPEARATRDALLRADDPHRLLFIDLPAVLGARPSELGARLSGPLSELLTAYPAMLRAVDARMAEALDAPRGDDAELSSRASAVSRATGDLRLESFASRLQKRDGSLAAIEGILSLAANKPPRDWTDLDIDAATVAVADLALAFRRAEALVAVEGRPPGREAFAVVIGAAGRSDSVTRTFEVASRDRKAVDSAADGVLTLLRESGLSGDLLMAVLARAGTSLANAKDGK
ncbi:MAG: ATP-binding protein [Proteobacteria bacterium]|nr:ATP-binding protein [Pseudomonadota bacterium]